MSTYKHLVVGATGGIGRATVKALKEREEEVAVYVRSKEKAEKYFEEFAGIEIIEGDAMNAQELKKAAADCKSLFYCINIPYPEWEEKAVPLLKSSLDAATAVKARFVFPGNVYVYGHAQANPVNEFHMKHPHTKKGKIRQKMENIIEDYATRKELKYTNTRFPDFYGPYVVNGFSEKLFQAALKGETMRWIGAKNVPLEYIFIEDAAKAMVIAGVNEEGINQEFNVPAVEPVTNTEYLTKVAELADKGSKFQLMNSDLLFSAMGMFDPMVKEAKEMMYLKREELILDGSKYRKTFGYLPTTSLEDGIKATLLWAKRFYGISTKAE